MFRNRCAIKTLPIKHPFPLCLGVIIETTSLSAPLDDKSHFKHNFITFFGRPLQLQGFFFLGLKISNLLSYRPPPLVAILALLLQ